MKLINQPSKETGCGVAVYAMVAEIGDFYKAEAEMKRHGWVLKTGNVLTTKMREALERKFGKKNIRMIRSKPKGKGTYLLFVRFGKKYRHWVVAHDGMYFDPLPRYRKPRHSIQYPVTLAYIIGANNSLKGRRP